MRSSFINRAEVGNSIKRSFKFLILLLFYVIANKCSHHSLYTLWTKIIVNIGRCNFTVRPFGIKSKYFYGRKRKHFYGHYPKIDKHEKISIETVLDFRNRFVSRFVYHRSRTTNKSVSYNARKFKVRILESIIQSLLEKTYHY